MALGQLINGTWVRDDKLTKEDGTYEKTRSLFIGNVHELIAHPGTKREETKTLLRQCSLFVSLGCPWAQRVLMARRLGECGDELKVIMISPEFGDEGWSLPADAHPLKGAPPYVHSLYTRSYARYTGRVTLPLLWDRKNERIISNDSAELTRLLGGAQLCPPQLINEINSWNLWLQSHLNLGPYRAGFAESQQGYEDAVKDVFAALDLVEDQLSKQPYLCGELLTESDLRLLPTLIRFDVAYYTHFKCNIRSLTSYPAISTYLRRMCTLEEIKSTISIEDIKRHYFRSVPKNEHIPIGPNLPFLSVT